MSTTIEWTDETWNPVTGCDRVSPGCDNCYALTLSKRLKAMGNPRYQNDGNPRTSGPGFGLTIHHDKLEEPLSWKRPRRIFVNSMSDLFHHAVPKEIIEKVFLVMNEDWPRPDARHQYQILTKRPKRMAFVVSDIYSRWELEDGVYWEPIPNVWLGTSIESDRYTYRADHLRATPAAVRFLSLEPLLSPLPSLDLTGIDWVIVGGESGYGHRPLDLGWVRDIRDHCFAASVPFFFKQVGGHTPKAGGRELDGRTWDEYPA